MSKTKNALREQILTSEDIESEIVTVPQWGEVKLEVRAMSGLERSRLLKRCVDVETGKIDFEVLYPLLVIATAHDPEDGEKIFTEKDIEALNKKSGAALEKVGKVASRLSGLDEEDVTEMGKP